MKKVFTLIVMAVMAMSANAQYQVPAEPGYFDLQNSSNWGGHWFNLGPDGDLNFDGSAYNYVWIKFSGNTGKFRFGMTYSEWKSTESWGETYYDAMNLVSDAEGISYIKIEKTKTYEFDVNNAENPYKGDTWDKHLRQVWTQDDGQDVSVTVEGIWFGTEAELNAALGKDDNGGEQGGEQGGDGWVELIANGDCEGADDGCLLSKDGDDMDNMKWKVLEGAGVDGSKCATVYATGAAANEWDAQFFIYVKDHVFAAGEKFKFSMMIKADKAADVPAQCHTTPGNYKHWAIITSGEAVKFTTEWTKFDYEGTIPAEADGIQTIAFSLNQDKTLENNYYFDNISWKIEATAGINDVKMGKMENGARYNLAGQMVDSSYKGVVIQNGKKTVQK